MRKAKKKCTYKVDLEHVIGESLSKDELVLGKLLLGRSGLVDHQLGGIDVGVESCAHKTGMNQGRAAMLGSSGKRRAERTEQRLHLAGGTIFDKGDIKTKSRSIATSGTTPCVSKVTKTVHQSGLQRWVSSWWVCVGKWQLGCRRTYLAAAFLAV